MLIIQRAEKERDRRNDGNSDLQNQTAMSAIQGTRTENIQTKQVHIAPASDERQNNQVILGVKSITASSKI